MTRIYSTGIPFLYNEYGENGSGEGLLKQGVAMMFSDEEWPRRLGALIRKYRKPDGRAIMTQETLAELVSEKAGRKVLQAQVSAHELGNRWRDDIDLIGIYGEILGIPEEEIREAIRLPLSEPEPRPKGFAEIVAADKTLSKAAKEHLLNQYELLQMATMHQRRGEPILHQDKPATRRKQA